MHEDIDNGSALVHIVCWHITDIIQKSVNLRLGYPPVFYCTFILQEDEK